MNLSAAAIRCESDKSLYDRLLEEPSIRRLNEQLARTEKEGGQPSLRRRLLATSVRLSESMAPELHTMADECGSKLELGIELELYVYASASYNAMCFKPEGDRLYVMFASSLLENFAGNELKFVMGHELGHHVYRHHDIPIGLILRGSSRPNPRLALDLFTWSRYAEISADRAGAHCAGDLEAVSRALFKLASGLSGNTIAFHLDDFLGQVDAMQVEDQLPGQSAPAEDWFSTHPFSPLRVKALQLFDRSELAAGKMSTADLEIEVQTLMSLMEPSYLDGRTDTAESMRRLLFAGALLVAQADGEITAAEVAVFEQFFGKGAFNDGLDLAALDAELDNRIKAVRDFASGPQALQVMRDLCLIARAEGHTSAAERAVLDRIADGLQVTRGFICHTMDADPELD